MKLIEQTGNSIQKLQGDLLYHQDVLDRNQGIFARYQANTRKTIGDVFAYATAAAGAFALAGAVAVQEDWQEKSNRDVFIMAAFAGVAAAGASRSKFSEMKIDKAMGRFHEADVAVSQYYFDAVRDKLDTNLSLLAAKVFSTSNRRGIRRLSKLILYRKYKGALYLV